MEETVECICLEDQGPDGEGDLWYDINDPETPERLVHYFKSNVETGQKIVVVIKLIPKVDFDRPYDG